jgi:transposase-like protein
MDDEACLKWLERHLHPDGFVCPHCTSTNRRLFRATQAFPAYPCRDCDSYYTLLTDTVFEKTRQRPATIVLLLHGVAQGETTDRLSRELGMSYNQVLTLQHRLQDNANETAPINLIQGTHFESDTVYQNAGEKR